MKKTITCIVCPIGCDITVEYEKTSAGLLKVIVIEGNQCPKGERFVIKEIENPERTIASSVKVEGGELPLVSVRTDRPIPKNKIFDVMREINKIILKAPVKRNQIIIKNVLGLDANIIATRTVDSIDIGR
ncbi:MAG: DUF1667 domain-containing protein [Candidatus Odinarchaeia archaeon]